MRLIPGGRPLVVMYHGFAERPRPVAFHLFVTVSQLRQQLAMLRRLRFRPLDLDGFLAAESGTAPGRGVLVTIDDGYRSVLDLAAPVLAEYGFPAVLFVPPGLIGATEGVPEAILTADELAKLTTDFDVEVGAHGWDHTPLGGLAPELLGRHTLEARHALAAVTGRLPRAFSYPNGSFSPAAIEAVGRAGYEAGFAVHDDAGPLARSRVGIYDRDRPATLGLKVALSAPALQSVRRRAHLVRGRSRPRAV